MAFSGPRSVHWGLVLLSRVLAAPVVRAFSVEVSVPRFDNNASEGHGVFVSNVRSLGSGLAKQGPCITGYPCVLGRNLGVVV